MEPAFYKINVNPVFIPNLQSRRPLQDTIRITPEPVSQHRTINVGNSPELLSSDDDNDDDEDEDEDEDDDDDDDRSSVEFTLEADRPHTPRSSSAYDEIQKILANYRASKRRASPTSSLSSKRPRI